MEFQTRTNKGQITNHQSMQGALDYAAQAVINGDPVWKISFTIPETTERIRLVRSGRGWILEDVFGNTDNPLV